VRCTSFETATISPDKERAMRVRETCALTLAFCVFSSTGSMGQSKDPRPPQRPAPLRELFIDLDTNNDGVVEEAEVPGSGLQAFRTLLKYGDANHDGKLEAGEFRSLLTKVNWTRAVPPEQRERRFKSLDRNQDGKLDSSEFQGGPARFAQLDRNQDGLLSRDEIPWLDTGKPAKPDGAAPEEARRADRPPLGRLKAMDRDDDGRVGRDEFSGPPAMFDRLDADHDGFIDRTDRKERKAEASGKK
jgi:Ca2+-binding EF-hand superfamily protein